MPATGKKPLLETLDKLHVSSLSDEHSAQHDTPDASLHELHSRVDPSNANLPNTKANDTQPASHQAASAPPPAMSATAVAALTQLLSACLAQQAMPTLQDIMKDRKEKLESSGAKLHALLCCVPPLLGCVQPDMCNIMLFVACYERKLSWSCKSVSTKVFRCIACPCWGAATCNMGGWKSKIATLHCRKDDCSGFTEMLLLCYDSKSISSRENPSPPSSCNFDCQQMLVDIHQFLLPYS